MRKPFELAKRWYPILAVTYYGIMIVDYLFTKFPI